MATDDNETKPLPEKVERALADAREAAKRRGAAPASGTKSARWLVLIPVTASVLALLLMMPRRAVPEDIPLPAIDGRALGATIAEDRALAASARAQRLSGDLLRVGSAIRAFNIASLPGTTPDDVMAVRKTLDESVGDLATSDGKNLYESLKALRAVQLEAFLGEVARYEMTGEMTKELQELGGSFVERMNDAGWVRSGKILLDDAQRRSAYKLVWTATVGGDRAPELKLTLDEQRALYTLYLARPHTTEGLRSAFEKRRRAINNDADCAKANESERTALETWRIEKIKKLGDIDPTYPTAYAMGVSHYRAGRYDLAAEAFRGWLEKHPDGRLSLRARNYLKASLTAYGPT